MLLKMSLLAQYEDLCRCTKILTSLDVEKKFKLFVENQLNVFRKRKKIEKDVKKLSDRIAYLEVKNECLEAKIKGLEKLNDDANSTTRKVKWEKKYLEKTIAAVKDIILTDGAIGNEFKEQLTFLNDSIELSVDSKIHLETYEDTADSTFSLANVDQTDDNLRNYKRFSNYQNLPSKSESSPEAGTSLIKNELLSETKVKLSVNSAVHLETHEDTADSTCFLAKVDQTNDNLRNYKRFSNYQNLPSKSESSPEAGTSLIKNELLSETKAKLSVNSAVHPETHEDTADSTCFLANVDQTNDNLRNYKRFSNYQHLPSKRESSPGARTSLIKNELLCETKAKLNVEADHQHNKASVSSSDTLIVSQQDFNQFKVADYQPNRASISSSSETITCIQQDFDQFKNDYDHKYDTNSISDRTQISKQFLLNYFNNSHQLVSKTILKSSKCFACGQNIGCLKQSLKCISCSITCHPECKNICPKICFPITNTPIKGTAGNVADYAPSTPPMIPPLVFHCVKEIESRGMKEIGLYRVPAPERDVRNIIDKFVSDRIIPCLRYIDTHTLCGAIKEFLRSLKEPLIARIHWQAFVDATNLKNTTESLSALFELVHYLPQPNRDTLSFLILHWQNVAESPDCKMDAENLSRTLGPIVLGSSIPESAGENVLAIAENQFDVMKRLLSIPISSWENMLGIQMSRKGVEETTENVSTLRKKQLLGPIYVRKG